MRDTQQDAPSWLAIRQRLATYDHAALLDLVQQLFEHSPDVQTFLTMHVLGQYDHRANLETYRQHLIAIFYPAGGQTWTYGLDLSGAQRLIQRYRQTTQDISGTLDLMLTMVETGTRFANDFNAMDSDLSHLLQDTLADLMERLQSPDGRPQYATLRERLLELQKQAASLGYGYSDAVANLVNDLRADMGDLPGEAAGSSPELEP